MQEWNPAIKVPGSCLCAEDEPDMQVRTGGVMLLKSMIPQHISNKTVLKAMEVMRKLTNHIPEKVIAENRVKNCAALRDPSVFLTETYIENQAQWETIRFGCSRHSNMKYSGCEIIATFNALKALGETCNAVEMAKLIAMYERDGAMLNGEFGVSPGAIRDFFRTKGYRVEFTDSRKADILNDRGEWADAVIVSAYNDAYDISAQVHTVCMTRNETGRFVAHNAYCWDGRKYIARDQKGEGYACLADAIAEIHEKAAPLAVIFLWKK